MIEQIFESLKKKKNILIIAHNNPDPDSIAAAFSLKMLITKKCNKKVTIAYSGNISRAENKALVKHCKISMELSKNINFRSYDHTIIVDAQPQSGNVFLPKDHVVHTIIDHHIVKKKLPPRSDLIMDIRQEYGSSCTIIAEYYQKLNIEPDEDTATAICMGISTDSIGNARDSSDMDKKMLGFIYPFVSLNKIARIQNPELAQYHYKTLKRAVENSLIVEDLLICNLGDTRNSELIAEAADYLLRMRDIKCVLVVGNVDNTACFSLRYNSSKKSVGHIAIAMVKGIGFGGGHIRYAGGQVPLHDKLIYDEAFDILRLRLISKLGIKSDIYKSL